MAIPSLPCLLFAPQRSWPMRTMLLAVVMAGVACAAAPPAFLTREQAEQNRQAFVLFGRAKEEWKAGKRDQALASMKQALDACERVWGRDAWRPCMVSEWLAYWERQRGNL